MPLDADDMKFIGDLIGEALKGLKIEDTIKGSAAQLKKDIEKSVDEKLKAKAPDDNGSEDGGDDDEANDGKAKKPAKGESAAEKKMAARLAKLEADRDTERKAREAAEAENREARLIAATKDALTVAGVPADRHAHALAMLHHAEKRLRFDEAGNPGLFFNRKTYEEIVPLEDGLAEWVKSDGAAFLPAKGIQGTGTGTGSKPSTIKNANGQTEIDTKSLGEKLAISLGSMPSF